jgi:hypothetical protein
MHVAGPARPALRPVPKPRWPTWQRSAWPCWARHRMGQRTRPRRLAGKRIRPLGAAGVGLLRAGAYRAAAAHARPTRRGSRASHPCPRAHRASAPTWTPRHPATPLRRAGGDARARRKGGERAVSALVKVVHFADPACPWDYSAEPGAGCARGALRRPTGLAHGTGRAARVGRLDDLPRLHARPVAGHVPRLPAPLRHALLMVARPGLHTAAGRAREW